jgi:hypothetical protein
VTVVVTAIVVTAMCLGIFGSRPLLVAGLAAIGAVVSMVSAYRDEQRYKDETIRLSFKPVPQDRSHPDQLWIGACALVAAFWMLSLYLVARDLYSPYLGRDAIILRWIARLLVVIFSVTGMALYSQRPKRIRTE